VSWRLPGTGIGWPPAAGTAWGFQSRWRTVRGVAIHARCSLAPPTPLILVHGLAVSHRYLMPLAARLAGHQPVYVSTCSASGSAATRPGPGCH
jgi:hypothetical protein